MVSPPVQVSLDVEALSVIESEASILDVSLLNALVVLASVVLASVLDASVLDRVVELEDLSSSSSFVQGEQSPGAQGNLNSGKSGHLKKTFVVVLMFQMTTLSPQLGERR